MICLFSIAAAFVAGLADRFELAEFVPEVSSDSIRTLLQVIASSMLVIAVFAVSSMLSAYASASNGATPRSFALVVADDVSQNALSAFIGAFIFSIISLVALMNGYYQKAGLFALFVLIILVFAIVILRFVRWVDSVARLGRLANTIDKVEKAARKAMCDRRGRPTLDAMPVRGDFGGSPVYADSVGYVQRVDVAALQVVAEDQGLKIRVNALPGTFATAARPLAYVKGDEADADVARVRDAFVVDGERTYDEDPRFGFIVLSEIASRALSPAVNDSGTAIDIIGTFVRLFTMWAEPSEEEEEKKGPEVRFDRVEVPELELSDMFDDAFNAIARDGSATLEVGVRLQKAFQALALQGNEEMKRAALGHSQYALDHAKQSLKLSEDYELLRELAPANSE
jgi:uncharacterized membrane protein